MLGRISPEDDSAHVIIKDRYVSRQQMLVKVTDEGIEIKNLGSSEIRITSGQTILQGGIALVDVPTNMRVGRTSVKVVMDIQLPDGDRNVQTISAPIFSSMSEDLATEILSSGGVPEGETIANWLESILVVQQSAAGSLEFYQETADAIVNSIGLDHGMVLLKDEQGWRSVATSCREPVDDLSFSRSVLRRVVEENRTFYEPVSEVNYPQSLANVDSVVASPVFGMQSEVIGAVYGAREQTADGSAGILPMEAQIMQLLACSVSAGLARIEREAKVTRLRIQFEEFVSPELVGELERDPSFLDGEQRLVTCLFADLRNFSSISETMSAQGIYELMRAIMDALTQCVLGLGGTIINYAGDGLAAMWNAPLEQGDHANRACQAALAMQEAMPALNEQWGERVGIPLKIGIGINSGEALVGNAGSSHRIKYGPMGHCVNLASRVEGATKVMGVPILITGNTRELLDDTFLLRELCQIRVVGIKQPATVYELANQSVSPQWKSNRESYEQALRHFQAKEFSECVSVIERVMDSTGFIDDRPSLLLSLWAHKAQTIHPDNFDPVYNLDSK